MTTPNGSSSGKAVILIVDDEPDLLDLVSDELKTQGYEVILAENGKQGIDVLSKQKVDAILSDVRMPEIDGLQFFDAIKDKCTKDISFMFMTGYPDISVSEALQKGAKAMIMKPFHLKELVNFVGKHVGPIHSASSL